MTDIAPVKREIVVAVPAERAFRVFTDGIDRWWPRQHHIGSSPLKRTILENGTGGRWYSECEDGSECDVGKVLTWDPPRRLVLAWQITADWQFDPSFVTEVEVNFIAEGPSQTRVQLEHRDLERYREAAPGIRQQIDAADGWPLILEQFAKATGETS